MSLRAIEVFQRAVSFQAAGRNGEAEKLCHELLSEHSDHVEGWHLLAAVQAQSGRMTEAEFSLRSALKFAPRCAELHNQLACLLRSGGRIHEGISQATRAVELEPANADYLFNLGNALFASRRFGEAADCFGRVARMQPAAADAQMNLGCSLKELGKYDQALDSFLQVVAIAPGCAGAHANAGTCLLELGRGPEAERQFRSALALEASNEIAIQGLVRFLRSQRRLDEARCVLESALVINPGSILFKLELASLLTALGRAGDAERLSAEVILTSPGTIEAYINRSASLMDLNRLGEAVAVLKQALALDPQSLAARINLANCHIRSHQPVEANGLLLDALKLHPGNPDVWFALGNGFQAQDRMEEALEAFNESCSLCPENAALWLNRGSVLRDLRHPHEAALSYSRALELDPANELARVNRGISFLQEGNWTQGWLDYRSRWRVPGMMTPPRALDVPEWQGEPPTGRVILVRCEQGFGDSIHFCRYCSELARRGATVIMEAPLALVSLMESVEGVSRVVTDRSPLPRADYQVFLLNLPYLLSPGSPDHQTKACYLRAREKQGTLTPALPDLERLKVGLVWAGSSAQRDDSRRSLRWKDVEPLLETEGIDWISLQVGGRPEDLEQMRLDSRIRDWGARFETFEDTALAVGKLDLVITVCTSVAHLAGALGAKTWTLLSFAPCWRWGMTSESTPWYPSMRLFRQMERGVWRTVIRDVRQELVKLREARLNPTIDVGTRSNDSKSVRKEWG